MEIEQITVPKCCAQCSVVTANGEKCPYTNFCLVFAGNKEKEMPDA